MVASTVSWPVEGDGDVEAEPREGDTVDRAGGPKVEGAETALERAELAEPPAHLAERPRVVVVALGAEGADRPHLEPQRQRVGGAQPGGERPGRVTGAEPALGGEQLGGPGQVGAVLLTTGVRPVRRPGGREPPERYAAPG